MTKLIIPQALKPGDQVAIISTARSIDPEKLHDAIQLLEKWGLICKEGRNLRRVFNQFAGTIEERASDLQWAITEENIKGIICFRGGYGTVQIIDKVNFKPLLTNPKWICGYSDITVLHNKVHSMGIASLHSTMPINFANNTSSVFSSLSNALFEKQVDLLSPSSKYNKPGKCTGQAIGGNLSIIYSLSGTNADIDTKGKILFLEDLDEFLYHIDRMMHNLKKSGKLHELAGLVIGAMTDMKDNQVPFGKTAYEIIQEATAEFTYPVCYDFPFGHIDDNQSVILGMNYNLSVTLEGGVLRNSE
ncbi:MAG: LD-carboxypeptidase [Crocinitomicaceae bacterium]|nr:LD-carboxypeptidase [Crocinitomicaceae bacterium]